MATTTSATRGVCAICGGTFALTGNGKIRAHSSTDQPRRCIGSGRCAVPHQEHRASWLWGTDQDPRSAAVSAFWAVNSRVELRKRPSAW
jgi:hypothetical protein